MIKIKKKIDTNIKSFSYYYGSGMGSRYQYSLKYESEKVIFTKSILHENEEIIKELSIDYVNELKGIINDNKIYKWNGFNKSNKHILDGNNFTLNVSYDNNQRIYAYGYMRYPSNYRKVQEILLDFLNNIE